MDHESLELVANYLAAKREIARHRGIISRYRNSMKSLVDILEQNAPEDLGVSSAGVIRYPRGVSRQHWSAPDVDFQKVYESIVELQQLLPKLREMAEKMRGIGQGDMV